jgi:phosphoribosylformylglycinamidine cyclo-ligase
MPLSYEQSGVDYGPLDAFKRACQEAAASTVPALAGHSLTEPAGVRGESAYLVEGPEEFLAHVEEGLGTKNLVADAMLELTGRSFWQAIGIDTAATIANDLATSGAIPISLALHAAAADSGWFSNLERARDLAAGFAEGCRRSLAVWGGGETPALKGVVAPGALVLAGSAVGRIRPKSLRIAGDIREGDAIVLLASSGIQTNGLTLCRAIAERLPRGYLTPLSGGRTFGEALLDPSVIYVRFIAACQRAGIRPRYAIHITGHGWRKLMRARPPFVYRIDRVPEPPEVFRFLIEHGPVSEREAYATFNMGAGFAVIVSPRDAERSIALAREEGYSPLLAGSVAKQGSRKAVEIRPRSLVYESDTLEVR